MRFSRHDWLKVLDNAMTGVLELVKPTERLRQNKYLDFLTYYFKLDEEDWNTYRAYNA